MDKSADDYGELTFWEIMTPLNFKSNPKYETRVSYTNRTDTRLPNSYRVEWDNQDKITILLQGNLSERITCKGCSHLGGEYRKGYCRIGENYQVIGCIGVVETVWMWITLVVMMLIMLFYLFTCLSAIHAKPRHTIGFRET